MTDVGDWQNDKFCRMGNFIKYSHSKAMAVFIKLSSWRKMAFEKKKKSFGIFILLTFFLF
jgi:hypothetical protein